MADGSPPHATRSRHPHDIRRCSHDEGVPQMTIDAAHSTDDSAQRAALLRRAYEGEIIGCAMYQEMLKTPPEAKTEALKLLYTLERVTADALEPLITQYQVTVNADAATKEGRQLANYLTGRPWHEMWQDTIRLAEDYLTDFHRLIDVLGDDAAVGRQVVEHEEALIAFAHREMDGAPDSLAPLHDYLQ